MNRKILLTFTALLLSGVLLTLSSCKNKDIKSDAAAETVGYETEIKETAEKDNAPDPDVTTSELFENQDFAKAFAEILDKSPSEITKDDCLSVKYIALGKDADGSFRLYAGFDDYENAYFEEIQKSAPDSNNLLQYTHIAPLEYADGDSFDKDLELFEKIKVFEICDVKINDVSFLKKYASLYYGYFNDNGITDVSALADYAPETLCELDFTGNAISDWSPLMHIKDEVIVSYSLQKMTADDGSEIDVPIIVRLTDITDGENGGASENQAVTYSENQVDWGELFED